MLPLAARNFAVEGSFFIRDHEACASPPVGCKFLRAIYRVDAHAATVGSGAIGRMKMFPHR